jgi:hypothetical protein
MNIPKVEEKLESLYKIPLYGKHLKNIDRELRLIGLKPKDNNKTVLYYFGATAQEENSLAALRNDTVPVFSFPSSYWSPRRNELIKILSEFEFSINELKHPSNSNPSEKESAHQIYIQKETTDRIIQLIQSHIGPRVTPN